MLFTSSRPHKDIMIYYVYNYVDHLGNVRLSYSDAEANGQVTGDIVINNCYNTPDGQVCNNYLIPDEAEGVTNYYPFGMMHNAQYYNANNNIYNYKYNGKELQETGMYDYGARFYMPDIGRWGVVDPLAEKYNSLSPYNYTFNNPIRFIDPDGRKVEDPDGLFSGYKSHVSSFMNTIKSFMENGNMNSKEAQMVLDYYKNIMSEITSLEKSEQVYTIFSDNSRKDGGMRYDSSTDKILIAMGDNSIGLIGHELKHAYQYESKQISISMNNSDIGALYDITDETEGYNRERILETGAKFIRNPKEIINGYPLIMSDQDVRDHGKDMKISTYQKLPSGPIDINSLEGKKLIQNTIKAGQLNNGVLEVYKGWQKDYKKGQNK